MLSINCFQAKTHLSDSEHLLLKKREKIGLVENHKEKSSVDPAVQLFSSKNSFV
jgi:hypothetical protein